MNPRFTDSQTSPVQVPIFFFKRVSLLFEQYQMLGLQRGEEDQNTNYQSSFMTLVNGTILPRKLSLGSSHQRGKKKRSTLWSSDFSQTFPSIFHSLGHGLPLICHRCAMTHAYSVLDAAPTFSRSGIQSLHEPVCGRIRVG